MVLTVTKRTDKVMFRLVDFFFFFIFLKSNNPACGSYAMAGGADASGRISRTKSIRNTTRSDTRYGITPSAKVLDRHAEAYILIGKQTHRTPDCNVQSLNWDS